eukprot:scaffold51994_cov65-Phaeocystis_antarctica.AAC.1
MVRVGEGGGVECGPVHAVTWYRRRNLRSGRRTRLGRGQAAAAAPAAAAAAAAAGAGVVVAAAAGDGRRCLEPGGGGPRVGRRYRGRRTRGRARLGSCRRGQAVQGSCSTLPRRPHPQPPRTLQPPPSRNWRASARGCPRHPRIGWTRRANDRVQGSARRRCRRSCSQRRAAPRGAPWRAPRWSWRRGREHSTCLPVGVVLVAGCAGQLALRARRGWRRCGPPPRPGCGRGG